MAREPFLLPSPHIPKPKGKKRTCLGKNPHSKLPYSVKPKRSHYKTDTDFISALHTAGKHSEAEKYIRRTIARRSRPKIKNPQPE